MKRLFAAALLCMVMITGVFSVTAAATGNPATSSATEAYGITCPDSDSGRHSYVTETTKISCTKAEKVLKCSVCGEVISTTEIEIDDHTVETVPAVAATCTTAGKTAGTKCSVCNVILSGCEEIAATGHTEEVIHAVAATCTTAGKTAGTKCSVCNAILSGCEVIPAAGHTVVTVPGKEATCTATGLTEGSKCSVCDEVLVAQETVAKLPHDNKVTIFGYEATCTKDGLTDGKKCSVCGTITKKQEKIPAAHVEETVPGKKATCTETGLTDGKKCSVCGEVLVEQEKIPATGHSTTSGTCEYCGKTLGSSGGSSSSGLDNVPKTGDITPYGLFLMMGLSAIAAMAWFGRKVFCTK